MKLHRTRERILTLKGKKECAVHRAFMLTRFPYLLLYQKPYAMRSARLSWRMVAGSAPQNQHDR